MSAERFDIRLGARSLPLLRLAYGVKPGNAYALIGGTESDGDDGHVPARPDADPDALLVRFGRVRFRTSLRNVTRWRIEGPWNWITAIGVRRSIRHGDISFDGSPRGGVRLDFAEPVRWSFFRVPAIYVGVEDLEGFAAALAAHGIAGEDARREQPAAARREQPAAARREHATAARREHAVAVRAEHAEAVREEPDPDAAETDEGGATGA